MFDNAKGENQCRDDYPNPNKILHKYPIEGV